MITFIIHFNFIVTGICFFLMIYVLSRTDAMIRRARLRDPDMIVTKDVREFSKLKWAQHAVTVGIALDVLYADYSRLGANIKFSSTDILICSVIFHVLSFLYCIIMVLKTR